VCWYRGSARCCSGIDLRNLGYSRHVSSRSLMRIGSDDLQVLEECERYDSVKQVLDPRFLGRSGGRRCVGSELGEDGTKEHELKQPS
jgi:hypothetical protein